MEILAADLDRKIVLPISSAFSGLNTVSTYASGEGRLGKIESDV
jgi:hypothetical protein